MRSKILWWVVRNLNLLSYFRNHLKDYPKTFYVRHEPIFLGLEGWLEEVKYHDYDEEKKEYILERITHIMGEKDYISVTRNQIFMHSK